jgi:hypothetical protein
LQGQDSKGSSALTCSRRPRIAADIFVPIQLVSARDLEVLKTYVSDTPLNSACITPKKDYVILGGGQAAMDVTRTSARQGKFEARFYHKIFEDEVGRVRGHFGPLVSRGHLRDAR